MCIITLHNTLIHSLPAHVYNNYYNNGEGAPQPQVRPHSPVADALTRVHPLASPYAPSASRPILLGLAKGTDPPWPQPRSICPDSLQSTSPAPPPGLNLDRPRTDPLPPRLVPPLTSPPPVPTQGPTSRGSACLFSPHTPRPHKPLSRPSVLTPDPTPPSLTPVPPICSHPLTSPQH